MRNSAFLVGTAVLVILIASALVLLNLGILPSGRPEVAQGPTPTAPVASPSPAPTDGAATAESATPAVGSHPTAAPTAGLIEPAETPPATLVPPEPTPRPTAPPKPGTDGLALLPPLSAIMGGGTGGGAGQPPAKMTFELQTALPENPGRMPVYLRDTPPLTPAYARQVAERLGLDARLTVPLWMTTAAAETERRVYVAVDYPREIVFDGTDQFHYHDYSVFPASGGRWYYPPEEWPSEEQALAAATAFLDQLDLLREPYEVTRAVSSLRFFRQLDSHRLLPLPFADVIVGPDGRVGVAAIRSYALERIESYPIISAEEAWELVSAGQPSSRLWYSQLGRPGGVDGNPRFWVRSYPAGERADLFDSLQALYPAESGDGLPSEGWSGQVTMNGLVLAGELEPLVEAHQALVESTGDVEAPMHVWGTVEDAGDYQVLRVEGWEPAAAIPTTWSGSVQQGLLVTDDGRSLRLPNLPADLPDGTAAYVEGAEWDGRLEWSIIQEHPADEGMMPSTGPAETRAMVEQAELVYLAPALDSLPPELAAEYGYRAVQPAWCFSGHTDGGDEFLVIVQAIDDAHVSQ